MGLLKTTKLPRESIKFIENLKGFIDNEDRIVLGDGFTERNILISHILENNAYNNKIKIGSCRWELKIYKSGDNISVEFKNTSIILDASINSYSHISAKIVVYIRNINDCNKYKYIESPFHTYDNFHNIKELNIIKISDLSNNNILDNNKCIFGAYIRLYKYDKEIFMNDMMLNYKEVTNINEVHDDFFELTLDKKDILQESFNSPEFKINSQDCILVMNSVQINKNSHLINVNIKNINPNSDEKYKKYKNYLYIRKCSDYSLYICGECHDIDGITFRIDSLTSSSNTMFENNKIVIGVYQQCMFNSKSKYKDLIKNSVENEEHIFESDGFFEWKIEGWNNLSNVESTPEFTIGNHTWKLELYPFGIDEFNNDFVSVRLKSIDANSDYSTHLCIKKVFYVRNYYDDYTCYYLKDDETFSYYNKYNDTSNHNILKHSDLYIERGKNNKLVIENDKCIFGMYIRIYKYNEEQYKDELISSIDNENQLIRVNDFYEWKIENWNYIYYETFSPEFKIDNYRWKLILYPYGEKENNQSFVTVKLQNLDVRNTNTVLNAKIVFFMKGVNNKCFMMKGFPTFINFKKNNDCFGVDLIERNSLTSNDRDNTFIENNECIIGVYIRIYNNGYEEINDNINYEDAIGTTSEESNTEVIEREIEEETRIDKRIDDIEKQTKALEQLEKYEKVLHKMKIFSKIVQEKEECEKKLENMKEYVKELEGKLNNGHYHGCSKKEDIEVPTLVIATNNFLASEYDQLDIKENEFLVVTNWNYDEGWVFGHRMNNEEEMGIFPKIFVRVYDDNESDKTIHDNRITPDYRIKFMKKIKKLRALSGMKLNSGEVSMIINRDNLYYDSYNLITKLNSDDLKKTLRIIYMGEYGVDAGGLLRDFFYQLSKEIGNPNYGLFQYSPSNSYELEINPKSSLANPLDLEYFKFIGRIMGLAILNNQYLPISFTLLFCKKLLRKEPEFSDLQNIDPHMYKNLNWLKENKGVEKLYLTFEIEEDDCFGNHKVVTLKPNGANIDVTDKNKYEYINLVVKHKLNNTENQFEAIREGFYDIIPKEINTIINEFDLKYLLSGMNEIDIKDWERNTVYDGYTKNDITIINFWKFVKELNNEKRTQLLLFATGNSQVPITGFKDLQGNGKIQRFVIKKAGNKKDLPISHTCFNCIDLPPYTSYTHLKQKLLRAMTEGMSSFQRE